MTAPSLRRRDLGVLCGIVVLLMSAVSIANLSVPVLANGELDATSVDLIWFVDAYVIAFACLLLPAEMIGARFGEERALLVGLGIFGAASLVAFVAPTMPVLIAARVAAGIGAGLALPQTLSILLHRGGGARRARIVAAWTASTSIAGVVGNGLGGPLVTASGWRSAFAVTAPLAVAAVLLVAVVVGIRARPNLRAPLDAAGTALYVVAVVAALIAVIQAPILLGSPALLAIPILIAILGAWAFVVVQRRSRHPLLNIEAFREPSVRAAAVGIVATFVGLFTLFSLHAHIVQTARGYSAAISGLSLVPISIVMFIVTYATVPLVRRWGLGPVVAAGLLVSAVGYLGVIAWGVAGSFANYEFALVVVGVGAGLCSSPLSTRLTMSYGRVGGVAGAGVNSTLREQASAIGVGIAGVALAISTVAGAREPDGSAVARAASGAFSFVIVMLVISLFVMVVDSRVIPRLRALSGAASRSRQGNHNDS